MHPIGSCVLRGADSHECKDYGLYGALRHGHPVATLSNDGGYYMSLSEKDINSANHHSFPGNELTLPGFDLNRLAHQQPYVVKEVPGFDPNYQTLAPEVLNFRSTGCRALAVEGGDHLQCDRRQAFRRVVTFMVSKLPLPDPRPGWVYLAGPTPFRAASTGASAAVGD
eukprot:884492-Pleurochrysis_carterae.AAC.1